VRIKEGKDLNEREARERDGASGGSKERASTLFVFLLRSGQAFLQPYSSTWTDASATLF